MKENDVLGLLMRRWKLSVWVVGFFLMLMTFHASAQDTGEVNRLVQSGNQSLATGELEDALLAYMTALEGSQAPELVYQVGDVQERLGNWESARFHFQLYLQMVPESPHSTKIGTRIEALKGLESTQSALEVVSSPMGAKVYWLGERAVGRTPARIPVHPGRHRIRLEKEGFESAWIDVEVFAGQQRKVDAELLPSRARVEVAEPADIKETGPIGNPMGSNAQAVSGLELSEVDLSPPGAVKTFGWIGLVGGFWALVLGWAADVPSVWIGGTVMMGGSGYLLFIHEWDELPIHESKSMPLGTFTFAW